jgi:outer membrane protein assembly factor BamB
MVTDGTTILALDEQGILRAFAANSERFELLAERKVSESESWAHLAAHQGLVFVRDLESLKVFQCKQAE